MILADKIVKLRKKNGWSQEELSEMLSVSRQSVSKWESAASIPDINKIIELAKVFGVTTDFLLKDDMELEEFTNEPDYSQPVIDVGFAEEFLRMMVSYGKQIALGVSLCILSPVLLLYLAGLSEAGKIGENVAGGIGVIVLLIMIATAVMIFIASSGKMKKYKLLETGDFELAYGVAGIINTKNEEFDKRYSVYNAIGVAMCIISSVPIMVCAFLELADWWVVDAICVLLMIVAAAVYIFVSQGMIKSSFDQLLKMDEYAPGYKERRARVERFSGFYWPVVTAIYLAISLPTNNWHITWVVWPVAALLYAGISALLIKIE